MLVKSKTMASLGCFGIFGVFSGDLGVLLSCKITRGMILVVGKVTERVQGCLRGFWGVHGVVKGSQKGVCLAPREQFLPIWMSCTAPDWVPNTT